MDEHQDGVEACPKPNTKALRQITAGQHGLLTRTQAAQCGFSRRQIERRLGSGDWEVVRPNVYRLGGTGGSWHQELMAAQLWGGPGTVLSHESAGALFHLDGVPEGVIAITTPRRAALEGVQVHKVGSLRPWEHGILEPFQVTGIVRTLFDLGSVLPSDKLEVAVEDALRRDDERFGVLARRLRQVDLRGRNNGARLLAKLIGSKDPSTPGGRPSDSEPEVLLERIIIDAGLPPPERQRAVRIGERTYRLDLCYPELKVAIEFDGYRWHWGREKWQRHLARNDDLMLDGWIVVHVTWDDLHNHPEKVVAKLSKALAMA